MNYLESDITKGVFAGLIAGIAATAAKTYWEEQFPVRSEMTPPPPEILADQISETVVGTEVAIDHKPVVTESVHWTFGSGVGVGYGVLAEVAPYVGVGLGLPFGSAFWLATHASTVPALGLEPYPEAVKGKYARNEFLGHLVYGVVLEVVRRGVRRMI